MLYLGIADGTLDWLIATLWCIDLASRAITWFTIWPGLFRRGLRHHQSTPPHMRLSAKSLRELLMKSIDLVVLHFRDPACHFDWR